MYVCGGCWKRHSFKVMTCTKCKSFDITEEVIVEEKTKEKMVKEAKKALLNKTIAEWIDLSSESSMKERESKEKKVEGVYKLNVEEMNRVFGEWIKKGAIYLLWWEPWIWKSTILQQIIHTLLSNEENKVNIWYFSGEENENQLKERSERLKVQNFRAFSTTCMEDIFTTIKSQKYNFVVIDSISTIASNAIDWKAWDVAQVKYCTNAIKDFMKAEGITCFLVGHVTKDMDIAWPKTLEHLVDAVIYLEGDRYWLYRYLRAQKNRHWPSDEVGIFEMTKEGLIPVENYHEVIMREYVDEPWCSLWIAMNNGRPLLTNVQVLNVPTTFNFPLRQAVWYPKERLIQILAIITSITWCDFSKMDIHLQIPWDIKFSDTSLDLAVAMAILSSFFWRVLDKTIYMGELTLKGLIRQPSFYNKRLKEVRDNKVVDFNTYKTLRELFSDLFLKKTS